MCCVLCSDKIVYRLKNQNAISLTYHNSKILYKPNDYYFLQQFMYIKINIKGTSFYLEKIEIWLNQNSFLWKISGEFFS